MNTCKDRTTRPGRVCPVKPRFRARSRRLRKDLMYASAMVLLCGLSAAARAQSPHTSGALLSPVNGATFGAGSTVTVLATDVTATVVGTPNGTASVSWQMWIKVDSGSRLASDEGNGIETLDPKGTWTHAANNVGTLSSANTYAVGTHTAQSFNKCIVGTASSTATDKHSFVLQ